MNVRTTWQEKNIINTIVHHLKKNRIVASTSDTVMGLLAPLTQYGFDALNTLKGRTDKPYLILIHDPNQASLFTDALHEKRIKQLTQKFWPGPLTIIVPAKESVPSYMKSLQGTIALRIPGHTGLRATAKQINGVFSTSANRTDKPIPQTVNDLDPEIIKGIALIVDDLHHTPSKPSTILDCTNSQIRIVRDGAYAEDQLRPYMNR